MDHAVAASAAMLGFGSTLSRAEENAAIGRGWSR
jgi:hypothetical protein